MKTDMNLMRGFILFCGLLSYSCSNDGFIESTDQVTESHKLPEKEVTALLIDFIDGCDINTKSGNDVTIGDYKTVTYTSFGIEDGAIDLESEDISVYEYDIKSGDKDGYALVVGDDRIKKVLSFVEYGSLDDTLFIEPLKEYMRAIPHILTMDLATHYGIIPPEQTLATRVGDESYYECFLPTEWGQTYPYNKNCPTATCTNPSYNGHYPAGCVPVAVAQILAYYQVPSSVSWSSVLSSYYVTSNSSATVQNQVGALIYSIGSALQVSYSCNGTGVSNSASVPSVLSSYGLLHGGLQSYSLATIINSLSNSRVVYMDGIALEGGHAFVCDGWYGGSDYNNLHINWGWNGSSNGWYYISASSPSFDTGSYVFNYNFHIIPDIRKY
ncbi:MAG: C10 family peptidase [Tannerellaceae bacterium]|nr:C10 family peptidase [Tannerellaceae bacterium]